MKRKRALLLAAALFTLCAVLNSEATDKTSEQLVREAKATIKEISVADLKKMVDAKESVVILDVRDSYEFEQGHIPGAINLSRGQLEFKVPMIIPDKNARVIVYCGIDLRGPLATKTLNELGYSNAVNLLGGLQVWQTAGYPVTK